MAAGVMLVIALTLMTRPLWTRRGQEGRQVRQIRRELAALTSTMTQGAMEPETFKRRQDELTRALTDALASQPQQQRPAYRWMAPALGLAIPVVVSVLYLQLGKPAAIAGVEPVQQANQPLDMEAAIASLRTRLEQDPNDAQGWALLGRSYMAIQNYADANDAFERAARLAPDEPAIQVALAESLIFVSGQPTLPARSKQMLLAVLETQPENQKVLWLLGLGAYQDQNWAGAVSYWDKLMAMLDSNDGAANQISGMLADARQKANLPEPDSSDDPPDPAGRSITVNVSLPLALQSSVTGHETLFVFARAPSGPPMPLAIQRLRVADLPLAVELNDSHAMVAEMNLSSREEVVVGARISRSGNATASPGDIQAFSEPVSTRTADPVFLEINQIVE